MGKIKQTLTLAILLLGIQSFAQVNVLSSSGTGSSPYLTLKAAFDDINSGVLTGAISISITDSTTETATASLNASGTGLASYTSLYIAPSGGSFTIKGAITAGNPLVEFNGADNVVINGLYNGVVGLTFMNTTVSSTAGTSTIRFINDATNDSLLNCNIRGASTSNVNGAIIISTTTGTLGNDNIVIDHCNIYDATTGAPQHGIQAVGSTATTAVYNDNCVVSNCNIYNFFATGAGGVRGINIGVGNNGWVVSNNSFYQTLPRTGLTSVFQFLSVAPGTNTTGFNIAGNYFGGSQPMLGGTPMSVAGTSTAAEFRSVIFATSSGVVNSFQGNSFGNMTVAVGYNSSTNVECLLQTNTSTMDIGTAVPNMFGDSTGQTLITLSVGSNANFAVMALGHGGPTTANVQNNVISGIRLTAGGSLRGIQLGNNTGGQNYAMNTYLANNTIGSVGGQSSLSTAGTASITAIFYNLGSAATTLQTITGNTIATLNAGTGAVTGINSSAAAANYTVTNNQLFRFTTSSTTTSNTIVGIFYASNVAGDTVTGNRISNFTALATSAASTVKGIVFTCATTGNNLLGQNLVTGLNMRTSGIGVIHGLYITAGLYTVANNVVSLGYDSSGASITAQHNIVGIYPLAATNGSGFYHNSVLIGGDGVVGNTTATFALFSGITTSASVGVTFQNNSWFNRRNFLSAPTGNARNFAAYFIGALSSGSIPGLNANYNLYSDSLINLSGGAIRTSVGTVNYPYLSDWKTATLHDVMSITGDPLYTSYNDLAPQLLSPLFSAGTPIASVTTDFNGMIRSNSTPTIGAGEGLQALPVSLLYLKAERESASIKVSWSTAFEVNNKMFVVQRSVDGKTFSNIGVVNGNGTTNNKQVYTFNDTEQIAGTKYYKLLQVDYDGKETLSNTVVVFEERDHVVAETTIYPNPFTEDVFLSIHAQKEETATVELIDMFGKVITTDTYTLQSGLNKISLIELQAKLSSNVFMVRVSTTGYSKIHRVMKLN